MMHTDTIESTLRQAERQCRDAGVSLTLKRKLILQILLEQEQALSAYEIAAAYQKAQNANIPVMSVYRMLDFLADNGLVHKLSTTNKFLPCSHISCHHPHQTPQFLICDHCHSVQEVSLNRDTLAALEHKAEEVQFHIHQSQLELHGLCQACYQQAQPKTAIAPPPTV